MHIHFLGTAGYHPTATRHTTCVMLPEVGIVLDAGTGTFRIRDLIQTPSLQIFLSHAHLDHCVGLTYLLNITRAGLAEDVAVYAEGGKLQAIQRNLFAELLFPVVPDVRWIMLPEQAEHADGANRPQSRDDGESTWQTQPSATQQGAVALREGGALSWFPLKHPGGSIGFRLDWPEFSLAYVTDTTADVQAAYVDKIRGVDVLIHECYFDDGHEDLALRTGHSTLSAVAEVAREATAGLLLLMHINPWITDDPPLDLAPARRIFESIELAEDGMVIEVQSSTRSR